MIITINITAEDGQEIEREMYLNEGVWQGHLVPFVEDMIDSLEKSKKPL